MRLLLIFCAVAVSRAEQSPAEKLIEAGHWKRARSVVDAPRDVLSNFLLSQIRAAFGDRATPLTLAEKAVALDGRTAKYHRQIAEVLGVTAQHAGTIHPLGRRFRKEIDAALSLDPRIFSPCATCWSSTCWLQALPVGIRTKGRIAGRIAGIDAVEGLLARARIAGFQKRIAARETMLRQAADTEPPRYKARIALAQFYPEAGHSNLSAAEEQAKAAMNLDLGRVDAYALLAAIYADRGAWSELDATLAASLREVPTIRYRFTGPRSVSWLPDAIPSGPSVICGCTWRRNRRATNPRHRRRAGDLACIGGERQRRRCHGGVQRIRASRSGIKSGAGNQTPARRPSSVRSSSGRSM